MEIVSSFYADLYGLYEPQIINDISLYGMIGIFDKSFDG